MSAPPFKKTCPCIIFSPTHFLKFLEPRYFPHNLKKRGCGRGWSELWKPAHFLIDQCDYKNKNLTCEFWPGTRFLTTLVWLLFMYIYIYIYIYIYLYRVVMMKKTTLFWRIFSTSLSLSIHIFYNKNCYKILFYNQIR